VLDDSRLLAAGGLVGAASATDIGNFIPLPTLSIRDGIARRL
jgi:hypothetical protein